MSPVFVMAPFTAVVLSLCLVLIGHIGVYIARTRYDLEGLPRFWSIPGCLLSIAVMVILPVFLTIPCGKALLWLYRYEGKDATPQQANEVLVFVDVPAQATEVKYTHSMLSGTVDEVDFTISEKDFLKWMRANDREPHRIYEPNHGPAPSSEAEPYDLVYPVEIGTQDSPDSIKVEKGYTYTKCDE